MQKIERKTFWLVSTLTIKFLLLYLVQAQENTSFELVIRKGHQTEGPIVKRIDIGEKIKLDAVLHDESGNYDFKLYQCLAHNGDSASNTTFTIVDDNGCAVTIKSAVEPPTLKRISPNDKMKHVSIAMYAFQIDGGSFLQIDCMAKRCEKICETQCSPTNQQNVRHMAQISYRIAVEGAIVQSFNSTLVEATTAGNVVVSRGDVMRINSPIIIAICILICIIIIVTAICVGQKRKPHGSDTAYFTPSSTPVFTRSSKQ